MKHLTTGLLRWIILAMILALVTGQMLHVVLPKYYSGAALKAAYTVYAEGFSVLSQVFLHLIKMIIAPLVFSILVVGVGKIEDVYTVGRLGLKTLVYFVLATLVALLLGLILVNVFKPGTVMQLPLPEGAAQIAPQQHSMLHFVEHVIPESIFKSLAGNEILPIVVFSLLLGIAIATSKSKGLVLLKGIDALSVVMFKLTHMVMKLAPIGVFGALSAVVTVKGLGVLYGYLYLISCFFGGLLFFAFVILALVCRAFKIQFWALMRDIREPVLLAFSTSSSESAMPKTIEALEKHGISNRIVSFVLPLGYSFNLDGSIMYMTFATVFIAQSYGIVLSMPDQLQMMLILMVTSKGMAGVPRASLVVIAGMLSYFNIPTEGLLLLLAVDQFLDMGRSATNVIGNAVASAVIARLEGEKGF